MTIIPLLPHSVSRADELRVVLFGLKPGVPLHEFVIAIVVIVVISIFFFYRWKGKSNE